MLISTSSTFRTALLLPSVLRRLDDILLVKELNAKFFDHSILEHHLHAAVSAPSAAVDIDYERLELLGPSFSDDTNLETYTSLLQVMRI